MEVGIKVERCQGKRLMFACRERGVCTLGGWFDRAAKMAAAVIAPWNTGEATCTVLTINTT